MAVRPYLIVMTRHTAAAAIVALVAVMGMAASPADFHVSLLNRGIADYNAGRDALAARELRIAAFGLMDSIQHYETAQIYLALVSMKLNNESAARASAEKVVAAEGVQRRYAALKLPAQVRTSFETLTGKLAGNEALSVLRGAAPITTRAPQTFTPTSTTPTPTPVVPQPKPVPPPTPERAPEVQPIPPPVKTTTPTPAPVKTTPPPAVKTSTPTSTPTPTPKPTPSKPAPVTPAPAKIPAKINVQARLAAGDAALQRNALAEARPIYRELLEANGIDHATMLLIAEGLYRSRDFAGTVRAFERAGALNRGEEPYRYYLAVAMYETGDYRGAKRELAGALPYIEVTADVARYRAKIDGAID